MVNPFVKFLWKHRKINFIISFILFFGIVLYVFLGMDLYYTANVVLLPPPSSSMIQGRLSSIANLVGISGGGNPFLNLEMYKSIVHSRKLQKKLLETSFEIIDNQIKKNVKLIDYLDIEGDSPREIYEKAYKMLNQDIIYSKYDEFTNLLSIEVTLKNPFLASKVANKIIEYLDTIVKEHLVNEFREQYKYLKNRIVTIQDSVKINENELKQFLEHTVDLTSPENVIKEMRIRRRLKVNTTIFAELKKQEELFIMQNIQYISPVKVLDYAIPPYRKSRPKRILVVFSLFIFSLFIQILLNYFVLFIHAFRKKMND